MGNNVIFSHSFSSTPPPPLQLHRLSSTRAAAPEPKPSSGQRFSVPFTVGKFHMNICAYVMYILPSLHPLNLPQFNRNSPIFHYSLFIHCYSPHTFHFVPISTLSQYPFTPLLTFIPLNPTFYPYFTPFLESTKI